MESFLKAVGLRDVPGIPRERLRRIAAVYGTNYDRVLQIARDAPDLAAPLGGDCDVIGAEILHAAREEMAVKLTDALMRRTEAGAAGHPGSDAVARAAAILSGALGWSGQRTRDEIDEADAFYRLAVADRFS
jgi:glycerol-3-phosphate dehydrogenase